MKYKEPKAMKEIHAIRLALHKEKKKLSAKEKAETANKIAIKLIKDYGLDIELLADAKEALVFK